MAGNLPTNGSSNGSAKPSRPPLPTTKTVRAPRRIVLLTGDERSTVQSVLAEYQGEEISGRRLHEDVQRLAQQQHGRLVAAEWLGPLGWTRFLWCRKR